MQRDQPVPLWSLEKSGL
jgi:Bardet-Biedl syndrome 7 protein